MDYTKNDIISRLNKTHDNVQTCNLDVCEVYLLKPKVNVKV